MQIIKNDHLGQNVWEYPGKVIERTNSVILLEAHFNRADLMFNGVSLREGDRFLELYPYGKWFNIYEIHDRDDDAVKGWYCNVTRPAHITDNLVTYDDLALDLLVYPDRKMLVLDEDEFSDLPLDDAEVSQSRNGLRQLQSIFSQPNAFQMSRYKEFI